MAGLAGRVALVTGSTQGIGRATAAALAAVGASVLVHGPDVAVAARVAKEIGAARGLGADLLDPEATLRLAREAGAVDVLILNASIEIRQDWLDVTVEGMRRQHEVNLRATLQLLQALVPGMRERGWGRVIAIGSVQEHRGNLSHLVYAGQKAAQTAMMLTLARTLGDRGVTFNVVQPGAIATDRNADVLSDPTFRAALEARIPARRLGAPGDLVGALLLLCGDEGAYVNGATLAVDGGMRL